MHERVPEVVGFSSFINASHWPTNVSVDKAITILVILNVHIIVIKKI